MGFREGEHRINRAHLADGDQTIGVRWVDHIAKISLAQAKAARDRRRHTGVADLQLGCIHLPLICRHRSLQLAHQRSLGINLLAGDGVLLEQVLVALQIQLGIFELGLIAGQRALHLHQCGVEAARVNLGQQLACFDFVTFLEIQLEQLARNLGPHHRRGSGIHGANRADEHPHITLFDHADRDWLTLPCAPGTTGATTAGTATRS